MDACRHRARRARTFTLTLVFAIAELHACTGGFSPPKTSILREQLWDIEGLSKSHAHHQHTIDETNDKDNVDKEINSVISLYDQTVKSDVNSVSQIHRRRSHKNHYRNIHRKRRQVSKKYKHEFSSSKDDENTVYFDNTVPLKGPKPGGVADVLYDEDYYDDIDNTIKTQVKNAAELLGDSISDTTKLHESKNQLKIAKAQLLNVEPPKIIKNKIDTVDKVTVNDTAVTVSADDKSINGPMMLMQEDVFPNEPTMRDILEDEEERMAVVPKCCPMGQNASQYIINGSRPCIASVLSFQPLFFDFNGTFMWEYDNNVWETIVGNPCLYDKYRLDPERDSKDEFYLLTNGSLLAPFHNPRILGPREYCMETFWDETSPGGLVMPLVCFPTPPTDEAIAPRTFIAYAIGLIISVPFLLATAAVYLLIPDLRNNHGLSLACHCICLACAFACLAATQLAGHSLPDQLCTVIAFVIQFSFLACFFWLNVLCIDIWIIVTKHLSKGVSTRRERRRFLYYSVYAWLMPLILLGITMLMDLTPIVPSSFIKPNFGASGCWFQTDKAAFPYFYGPVALVIATNIVFFVLTSRSFAKQHELLNRLTVADLTRPDYGNSEDWMRLNEALDATSAGGGTTDTSPQDSPITDRPLDFKHRWRKYKNIFRMCCILSVVMGLSWALEIISWAAGGPAAVWSVFDVINALQGVIIFGIFVMQKSVRDIVWKRLKEKSSCSRWNHDSELEVVSERTVITTFHPNNGRKRDYV